MQIKQNEKWNKQTWSGKNERISMSKEKREKKIVFGSLSDGTQVYRTN